ncbi:DUF397 domain-containing protein [Yinghuangia sp. KLBMP8922]|uniref:DUF397 domain-containing protein n=1 Tax=Yinghuangia soli TaxID=2908204 RepID=A0AA41PW65_9ACTN|nr:DUF397 domain-containing protein [Yinghuangia soli]
MRVRDSKLAASPELCIPAAAWSALVARTA